MSSRIFADHNRIVRFTGQKLTELFCVLFFVFGCGTAITASASTQSFNDWTLHCSETATAQGTVCSVSQTVKVKTAQGLTSLIDLTFLYEETGRLQLELTAPLNLDLNSGIALSWGNEKPVQLDFSYCSQQGCIAKTTASQKLISGFKRANTATAFFRLKDLQGVRLVFSLKGYTKALKALTQLGSSYAEERP